ncbi:hypothetical protein NLJ89_g5448 [Agrocybe chaxingu]|uniref:Aquaporin-like protein n=1 Tax=Agrocybe chaxingu TaxID=84603 RepID=A0A9W8K0K0_9AGAR|nr:hypothetical protein NLJ89_g5448 [Agrocybe chaxingu]
MTTPIVHLRDVKKRPGFLALWEKRRNSKEVHWAIECFAEMLGVFLYVYFGVGSTAGFVIGNILSQPLSSLFQVGMAYAVGILFALGVCASTSGGHINPCITVSLVVFKGFPKLKAVRYITAQIIGAYIASWVVYSQWKFLIVEAEETLKAQGVFEATQFTPNGPAGIFGLYLFPGQSLGRVFLNEWVNCTMIGLVLWAALDPTTYFLPPAMGPWVVALTYAACIWGFAVPGISLNTARDVGGRLMAMSVWAAGGRYAAIAALTNIPATLFAVFLYEFFLADSDRVVTPPNLENMNVHANHRRLRQEQKAERRSSRVQSLVDLGDKLSHEKPSISAFDHAPSGNVVERSNV